MAVRSRSLALAAAALLAGSLVASGSASASGTRPPRQLPVRIAGASPVLHGGLSLVAASSISRHQAAIGAPETRPGSEAAPGDIAVSITISAAGRASTEGRIEALGGRIANRDPRGVEAYVPGPALVALAGIPGILRIDPIRARVPAATLSAAVTLQGGSAWQSAGTGGTGVRVGIIDGGFSGIRALQGVDLPSKITAHCYTSIGAFTSDLATCEQGGEAHGTAVAETVSAMAPDASLWIADPTSQDDLLATIAWMTSNGVRIINASWTDTGFEGPGDGTSPYTDTSYALVDDAVARGALWVNAAGNSGEQGWVGPWREDAQGWLEFSGTHTADRLTLQQGDHVVVSMRWSDPWGRASDDYDLALYQAGDPAPVASSSDVQNGRGDPVETLEYDVPATGDFEIAAHRHSGAAVSRVQVIVQSESESALQYAVPDDTLTAPSDGRNPGMLVVGAVDAAAPGIVEAYSGRGPTVDGRIKPDLVAADCTDTRAFAPFCGTSQSTPFVSGAAADVLSAHPGWTTARLVQYLTSGAFPLGTPTPNPTAGYGRLALGPAPNVPAGLRFVDGPVGGVAGAPLVVQPVVEIVDDHGDRVVAGAGATLPVTLSATDAAQPAGLLVCTAGTTVTATAGVARFSGCSLGASATHVVLAATTGTLPPATASPFDVLAGTTPAAALGLAASTPTITWGSGATLSMHLSDPLGGSPPLDGRRVELQSSVDGISWASIAALTTGGGGTASATYRPSTNLWYRAVLAPSPDLAAAESAPVRVVVRQIALLRPPASTRAVARGAVVTFSTTVRPLRPELPTPAVAYRVYQLVSGTWRLVARTTVTARAGIAAFTWHFTTAGSWYVRSQAVPTPLNANSVWSTVDRFVVR